MTPQEKAEHLVQEYFNTISNLNLNWRIRSLSDFKGTSGVDRAKECAIICVNKILAANPHSNPFNTDVYSTMDYWNEVKKEIQKL